MSVDMWEAVTCAGHVTIACDPSLPTNSMIVSLDMYTRMQEMAGKAKTIEGEVVGEAQKQLEATHGE